MRALLMLSLSSMMLGWQPPALNVMTLHAPEFFGTGRALIIQGSPQVRGLIFAPDFVGTISGTLDGRDLDCRIDQVGGVAVDGADKPIHCHAFSRGDKWTGWIDFRGHQRKFCAAPTVGQLPQKCGALDTH